MRGAHWGRALPLCPLDQGLGLTVLGGSVIVDE